jgi:hypothetical protein
MKNLGTVTKNDEEVLHSYRPPNKPNTLREMTPRILSNNKQRGIYNDINLQS